MTRCVDSIEHSCLPSNRCQSQHTSTAQARLLPFPPFLIIQEGVDETTMNEILTPEPCHPIQGTRHNLTFLSKMYVKYNKTYEEFDRILQNLIAPVSVLCAREVGSNGPR